MTVVADMAHLTAVSVWIGGLVMLAAFLLRRANPRELTAVLPVWSNWAMLAVTVLVLSGVAQALIEIGTVHALLSTTYGRIVLIKVGLLAVVLVIASQARRLVATHAGRIEAPAELVPAAAGATGGPARDDLASEPAATVDGQPGMDRPGVVRRLRRSVLVEAALAVVILVATSILVQSTPARTAAADSAIDTGAVRLMTLHSSLYTLKTDTVPGKGRVQIYLYAYTPAGAPLKVLEWHMTATLPARDIGPLAVAVTPLTDSRAVGQLSLPVPGQWTFAMTLRTSAIDEATVTMVESLS